MPSRTWPNSCGGVPPSDIDGKISIFTRPPEACSMPSAQGASIFVWAGALGPRKWWSLRLKSAARARPARNTNGAASTAAPAPRNRLRLTMVPSSLPVSWNAGLNARRCSRRDGFVSNYTPAPRLWIASERRQPDVEDGAALLVADGAQRLGDRRFDLARMAHDAAEGAAGRHRDGGVVWRRIEAHVDVGGAAGITVGMDREDGELRRLPAAVVVDDLQERSPVPAGHPVHG